MQLPNTATSYIFQLLCVQVEFDNLTDWIISSAFRSFVFVFVDKMYVDWEVCCDRETCSEDCPNIINLLLVMTSVVETWLSGPSYNANQTSHLWVFYAFNAWTYNFCKSIELSLLPAFCHQDLSLLKPGKIFAISMATDSGESEPWQAFLVSVIPKRPRMLSGCEWIALKTFVGPRSSRHFWIAFSRSRTSTSVGPLKWNIDEISGEKA